MPDRGSVRVVIGEDPSILQRHLDAQRDSLNDRRVILSPSEVPSEPIPGELHYDGTVLRLYNGSVWVQIHPPTAEAVDSIPPWVRERWALEASLFEASDIPTTNWRDFGGM